MISDKLKKIVEQLNNQGTMRFLEPATEEQISQFEKTHNINFPEQYKEWLLYSAGGEFFLPAGVQVYGVATKPLIDVDEDDRPNDEYVVIGALCTGDPILCRKDSEEISIYNHEAGVIEDDETYPDFHAFLNDLYVLLGTEG